MTRTSETVRTQEIRALFEQAGPVLWANLGVGAVVVGTLWSDAPHQHLLWWLLAVGLVCGARALFQRQYRRERPDAAELEAWGRRFVLGSTCAGALWGVAGVLFFVKGNALSQGLLTFVIGGMTAAAAGTLSCYLPAFFGFFVCALTPLAVRAFVEGDRIHFGMSAMLLTYSLAMQRIARNNHSAFVRAFRLGIENAELFQQLSLSQVDLQETNRTLEQRVLERTEALEQQGEALRQAQRLEVAGRLAGGLAHDFNSLLTVVINNSLLMKESQRLDEHGKMAAEETLEAAQRGAALIRQLLAVSRRKRAEPRVFSLNQLVQEWADLLRRILGQGTTTQVVLAQEPTPVRADPAHVEQVLVNLVANARAAMPNGGQLSIATRLLNLSEHPDLAPGDYVELSVEHAGVPHLDGETERVFDPYFAFDADVRQRNLRTTTAWAVAEQWGGRVLVEAEHTTGARFRVFLPVSAETPSQSSIRIEEASHRRGATILVVDDEPTLRSVMRRCLARDGYKVLLAEDGPRALALAKSETNTIDLLITDVVMPGMSGIELARQLLLERPALGVLFISGFTFEELVPATNLDAGTAYLPKPFETKVLSGKVRELLVATAKKPAAPLKSIS